MRTEDVRHVEIAFARIVHVGGGFPASPTMLDLLVAFVLSGDRWLTPAELAKNAWQLDYHAVRHHSRVAMAVARLRELIGADWIESGRDGYRFKLPKSWLVVKAL